MNEETKKVIRDIYEMVRTNNSDYTQYSICNNLIKMYPKVFKNALKSVPYTSIPRLEEENV
jgi:hypothetical protein